MSTGWLSSEDCPDCGGPLLDTSTDERSLLLECPGGFTVSSVRLAAGTCGAPVISFKKPDLRHTIQRIVQKDSVGLKWNYRQFFPSVGQVWPVPPHLPHVLPATPRHAGQLTTGRWHLRHDCPLPRDGALKKLLPAFWYGQSLPC